VVLVAAVFYPGIGLILPIGLGWSTPYLVDANVFGTMGAGVLSLGWLAAQVEAAKRRHLLEWTTELRHLNAEEFEWLVGETFRREGWKVEETGRQDAPDGNVDLVLTRDRQRKIVQCKRWESSLVGVDDVRGFAGTLLSEGMPGTAGIFVTLSDFTQYARLEADKAGLTLLNGQDLYSKVEKVRRLEPCPICQKPMRLDRSPRGWWFRCVAPGCNGKQDLASEPGRAVDILTQSPQSRSA
jgi:HJR/Mrr/RecB family endonuclease